jgi:hypothetical protein
MMDADWIEWYYRMCDDCHNTPMFPNILSSDEHFNLENITEQDLHRCCCKRTCLSSPCSAFKEWKKAFLRSDGEENRSQLDAFCREREGDSDSTACRELILWIWFRLAQRQERSLHKTFDESLIEILI